MAACRPSAGSWLLVPKGSDIPYSQRIVFVYFDLSRGYRYRKRKSWSKGFVFVLFDLEPSQGRKAAIQKRVFINIVRQMNNLLVPGAKDYSWKELQTCQEPGRRSRREFVGETRALKSTYIYLKFRKTHACPGQDASMEKTREDPKLSPLAELSAPHELKVKVTAEYKSWLSLEAGSQHRANLQTPRQVSFLPFLPFYFPSFLPSFHFGYRNSRKSLSKH